MMTDKCAACGRPVVAIHSPGPPITLERVYIWRHLSRFANMTHHAIPERMVNRNG